VQDASYLRLRNVTISYRFKPEAAQKIGLDGLTLSVIGTNLLTFTNFTGLDPEVARDFTDVTDRNMSLNTTYLTAPQEKTYSIRLTANF
jgi:TonB dependent receptor.